MNTSELIASVDKSIENRTLFHKKDKLLLAISGGLDSMAMLDILRILKFDLNVAHINHKLRAQSEDESQLVKDYCDLHNIPFHLKILADAEVNDLKNGNLQAKARQYRYHFLNGLLNQLNFKYICTAHHQQDQLETMFLHLLRGSGLRGLSGIAAKSGNIRRPILDCSKVDLLAYLQNQNLPFLEDESNSSDDYDRNYIRHHILKPLCERWPDGFDRILQNITTLSDQHDLFQCLVNDRKNEFVAHQNDRILINKLQLIADTPGGQSLLFELLSEYDFSPTAVQSIFVHHKNIGAIYRSPTHKLLVDRDSLIVTKKEKEQRELISIEIPNTGTYVIDQQSKIKISAASKNVLVASQSQELIDANRVKFPLYVEFWEEGDHFYPLGMGGRKKLLSDFFIDNKVDSFSKAGIPILKNSNKEIIWIIGMRLDDRFKLLNDSEHFYILEYLKQS